MSAAAALQSAPQRLTAAYGAPFHKGFSFAARGRRSSIARMNNVTTAQGIASSDAIASVAGKLTVASGAGTAVYAAGSNENMLALIGLVFTALSFFVNWYYERRAKQLRQQEIETSAALQREKNEREYELQRQRLEIETFDREERRRIMEDAWARAEKRRAKQSEAMIAEMRKSGKPFFAPDSIIGAPFDMAGKEGEQ